MQCKKIARSGAVVARWAHNPKVVGSNPASATKIVSHEADARASPESRGGSSYSYSTYTTLVALLVLMPQSKPCPLREDVDKERLLDFLLRFATTQTSVGVQTSRIVINTTRIAHAYGYEPTIMTFQRNITMTLTPVLGDGRHSYRPLDAHPVSGMLQHRHGPLNFFYNAELSRLSWFAYDNHLSLDELEERFQRIIQTPPMNRWLMLYLISQANMAFCLLFGGDLMSGLFVFLGTFCGFLLRQELNRHHVYHYLTVVLSALVASFIVGVGAKLGYEEMPKIALSASVLYLIPGVPFINGMMDVLDGYVLNGISRLLTAVMIVVSITVGLSFTLMSLDLSLL